MQTRPQFLNLCGLQLGTIATSALVNETRYPVRPVRTTPIHKTCSAASSDVHHLLDWIAGAIQPHGLIASTCRTVFAAHEGICELLHLLFG